MLQELGLKLEQYSDHSVRLISAPGKHFMFAAVLRRYRFDGAGRVDRPIHKMTKASIVGREKSAWVRHSAHTDCDNRDSIASSADPEPAEEPERDSLGASSDEDENLAADLYATIEDWQELEIVAASPTNNLAFHVEMV